MLFIRSSAAGRSPECVAGLIRQSREFREAALRYLDKAVQEWRTWYPRDPFPDGEPGALRRQYGGSLAPRQPSAWAR